MQVRSDDQYSTGNPRCLNVDLTSQTKNVYVQDVRWNSEHAPKACGQSFLFSDAVSSESEFGVVASQLFTENKSLKKSLKNRMDSSLLVPPARFKVCVKEDEGLY